jgi:hypothetical protein
MKYFVKIFNMIFIRKQKIELTKVYDDLPT